MKQKLNKPLIIWLLTINTMLCEWVIKGDSRNARVNRRSW